MTPSERIAQDNAHLRRVLEERNEEIAALRRQVSAGADDAVLDAIAVGCRLARQEAWLLATLYAARGRILSKERLNEVMPSPAGNWEPSEREPKILDVIACRVRSKLDREAIQTVWGKGFRITAIGSSLVERMIAGEVLTPPTKLPDRVSKLDSASACAIKALHGKQRADAVASRYGVSTMMVYAIWRGDRWAGSTASVGARP